MWVIMVIQTFQLNRSYFSVVTFTTLGPWLILLAGLSLAGFQWEATPIQMGIVVMCFSGPLALFGSMGAGLPWIQSRGIAVGLAASLALLSGFMLWIKEFWQLYVLLALLGMLMGLLAAALEELLKKLLMGESYQRAESFRERISEIGRFVGPGLAALLLFLIDDAFLSYLAIALYVLAVLGLFLLRIPALSKEEKEKESPSEASHTLSETLRTVLRFPMLWGGLLLVSIASLLVTLGDSQLVILFRGLGYKTASIIGWVMASSGLGVFVGTFWFNKGKRAHSLKYPSLSTLGLGAIFLTVGFFFYQQWENPWAYVLLFLFGGVCWSLVMHPYFYFVEQHLTKALATGVMLLTGIIIISIYTFAPIFGGLAVTEWGIPATFGSCGLALIGFGFLTWSGEVLWKRRRSTDKVSEEL